MVCSDCSIYWRIFIVCFVNTITIHYLICKLCVFIESRETNENKGERRMTLYAYN